MGLQKTPSPAASKEDETEQVPPVTAAPPSSPEVPPVTAEPSSEPEVSAAEAKPAKAKGKTMNLLAVKRPISDPMTGVEYDLNVPRPGVVKEGNWLHAQMIVGILKEWTPPSTPEIEA